MNIASGPDFAHTGVPRTWSDSVELDERFLPAIDAAFAQPAVDIEGCRWSADDPLVDTYAQWWASQSRALRRHIAQTRDLTGRKVTIRRRVDSGDGLVVTYVRVNRVRPAVVRDAAAATA